jgi:hypothetical protein
VADRPVELVDRDVQGAIMFLGTGRDGRGERVLGRCQGEQGSLVARSGGLVARGTERRDCRSRVGDALDGDRDPVRRPFVHGDQCRERIPRPDAREQRVRRETPPLVDPATATHQGADDEGQSCQQQQKEQRAGRRRLLV